MSIMWIEVYLFHSCFTSPSQDCHVLGDAQNRAIMPLVFYFCCGGWVWENRLQLLIRTRATLSPFLFCCSLGCPDTYAYASVTNSTEEKLSWNCGLPLIPHCASWHLKAALTKKIFVETSISIEAACSHYSRCIGRKRKTGLISKFCTFPHIK